MLAQIKIAARGDAFQFVAGHVAVLVLFAERELEQNIRAGAGVMRKFRRRLMMKAERRARKADAFIKAHAFLDPVFVPRFPAPIICSSGCESALIFRMSGLTSAATNYIRA